MAAKASVLPSPYVGPELVPHVREPFPAAEEAGNLSASSSEGATHAKHIMEAIDFEVTAIDFEVESARSLYGRWNAEPKSDVYLLRTLERISEHLRALHAIQADLNDPGTKERGPY